MKTLQCLAGLLLMALAGHASATGSLRIAAAADLKFAMDEIAATFRQSHPDARVEVIYGSSGNFKAQIQQGAPFDLFFSADIAFPRELREAGLAASEVRPYATGRIVLWSGQTDASKLTLADLTSADYRKIAIANPTHAPYGKRAEEALRASGVWGKVEPRLVYGENIAQTAQFVQSGNAQIGIIALSLALNPELAGKGGMAGYYLIPDALHEPLEQGFIITRRAAGNPLARDFADFMDSTAARATMVRYGFVLPGEQRAIGP
ncbi:MAG: molybdate ABC transporter substrate-binding protein [Chromatiales bacterium]|nr:molybdate ABC transporter substrate-binding protein [Chromatiales bacterium]